MGAALGGLLIGIMAPVDLLFAGAGFALAGIGALGLSVWAVRRWRPAA